MSELNAYETAQLAAIAAWKAEDLGVVSHTLGVAVKPFAWLVQKIVPEAAVHAALDGASALGQRLTDTNDICRKAQVQNLADLRVKSLELSDKLANDVHNWAIATGAAEGAATGAFGILAAAVDIPAIITLAMRTIHKLGACYGYTCETEDDQKFIRGVLAAAGANSMEEKLSALSALASLQTTLASQTWKAVSEKAAHNRLGKEAALLMIRNLAKQVGVNITKRRALAIIPVIGVAVGGSVNGWYIKEVGWAARRAFQERWLVDNAKVPV